MVSGCHQDQDLVDQLLDLAATITKDGVQAAAKSKLSGAASMMDAGSYAAMLLKLKVMATTLQELVLYGSSIRPTNSSEPPIKDRSAIGERAGQRVSGDLAAPLLAAGAEAAMPAAVAVAAPRLCATVPPPPAAAVEPAFPHHRYASATPPSTNQCTWQLESDLAGLVFSFLCLDGSRRPWASSAVVSSSVALGRLALVCRQWRHVARWDQLWQPVAATLFPVLQEEVACRGLLGEAGGWWWFVVRYGRCLSLQPRLAPCGQHGRAQEAGEEADLSWARDLRLSFEVFESDGLRLLSTTGPLAFKVYRQGGFTTAVMEFERWRSVRGPAFSAASRGRASLREYFGSAGPDTAAEGGGQEEAGAAMSPVVTRAVLVDERTGRMAVLWQGGGPHLRRELLFFDAEANLLPEGSLGVVDVGRVPASTSAFHDGLPAVLDFCVTFHVQPEPGQDQVPECDRLYRVAGGDQDPHYMQVMFRTTKASEVARVIKGLHWS